MDEARTICPWEGERNKRVFPQYKRENICLFGKCLPRATLCSCRCRHGFQGRLGMDGGVFMRPRLFGNWCSLAAWRPELPPPFLSTFLRHYSTDFSSNFLLLMILSIRRLPQDRYKSAKIWMKMCCFIMVVWSPSIAFVLFLLQTLPFVLLIVISIWDGPLTAWLQMTAPSGTSGDLGHSNGEEDGNLCTKKTAKTSRRQEAWPRINT